MAKVKGTKVLNKAITKELSAFGIKKAVCGDEYAYYYDKKAVSYKITEGCSEDLCFSEFLKERFDYDDKYPFVMSLLHEVGHHKANDDIVGEVYDFCLAEKKRIQEEMLTAVGEESKKLEWQYFNLPDEIMATKWAVEYAKAHPKKVKKMWKKMRKAFFDFYKKNGLFDEIED